MSRPLIFISYSRKNEREMKQLVTQFREILIYVDSIGRVEKEIDRFRRNEASNLEARLAAMLALVNHLASSIEDEGIMRGMEWVRSSAAVDRCAATAVLQVLERKGALRNVSNAVVAELIQEASLAPPNDYRTAWRFQHLFARVTRLLADR